MQTNYPINRLVLKKNARERTKAMRPGVWKTALVYLLLTSWLSLLLDLANMDPISALMGDLSEKAVQLSDPARLPPLLGTLVKQHLLTSRGQIGLFLVLALGLFSMVLRYGMTSYSMHAIRGADAGIGELFRHFYLSMKIVGVELLVAAIVTIVSSLTVWLLALPAIVLLYCYRLVPYVLLDQPEAGVIEILRRSRKLMKGRKMELVMMDMSFLLWLLGGFLIPSLSASGLAHVFPPVVASLIGSLAGTAYYIYLIPYQEFTYAGWYDAIRSAQPAEHTDPSV